MKVFNLEEIYDWQWNVIVPMSTWVGKPPTIRVNGELLPLICLCCEQRILKKPFYFGRKAERRTLTKLAS